MNASFEEEAVAYFSDPEKVGVGLLQRIDGVACFSPLPKFWFWRLRLWLLARKGVIKRVRTHTLWGAMPAYGISKHQEPRT